MANPFSRLAQSSIDKDRKLIQARREQDRQDFQSRVPAFQKELLEVYAKHKMCIGATMQMNRMQTALEAITTVFPYVPPMVEAPNDGGKK